MGVSITDNQKKITVHIGSCDQSGSYSTLHEINLYLIESYISYFRSKDEQKEADCLANWVRYLEHQPNYSTIQHPLIQGLYHFIFSSDDWDIQKTTLTCNTLETILNFKYDNNQHLHVSKLDKILNVFHTAVQNKGFVMFI